MSLRLTIETRVAIVDDIMEHTYKGVYAGFRKEFAALAQTLYLNLYPASMRRKMNKLPEGWLPTRDDIDVSFNGKDNDSVKLDFNGEQNKHTARWLIPRDYVPAPSIEYRYHFADRYGINATYDAKHPLSVRYYNLVNRLDTKVEQFNKDRLLAMQTLRRCNTVKQLLEVWPEVKPFVDKRTTTVTPVMLPAVPVDILNKTFKLPVIGQKETAS